MAAFEHGPFGENNHEAAGLLLAMIGGAPNYSFVPQPVLQWYWRRRIIALELAKAVAMFEDDASVREITQDIAVIEYSLEQMR